MFTALALIASLQAATQTVRVEVNPRFINGVHASCEVSFDVIVMDTAYHGGMPVAASGSLSFYNWPDQSRVFVGLKLGISPDGATYTPPTTAYLVNGYKTNASEQLSRTPAENPQFALFAFDVDGEQTLDGVFNIGGKGSLTLAYTMGRGSMPSTFPVEISNDHAGKWSECFTNLISRDQ